MIVMISATIFTSIGRDQLAITTFVLFVLATALAFAMAGRPDSASSTGVKKQRVMGRAGCDW